ncbi:S-layer protein [Neobacillus piezotolerans]|uniref:S-layer protein n=1 Tax=Neobacillus piezotolerans TaxID=2259171 RepID=A0A3D8GU25_9BACI|nr:S-layer protein [Neobacillus piezotolerans]RDU37546.1 S-layer protein [Neobacillus piezotolerans]
MKKKAIKIAAASAVAASAFVAAAPAQTDAATNVATEVSKAVTQMKKAYHTYSDITATGEFADINVVYKEYNAAKIAYNNAKAIVTKAGGAQKEGYLAQLEVTYDDYIAKRVVTYIDAYNYAVALDAKRQALAKALTDKDWNAAEKLYHEISYELKTRTVILHRVYGESTRELFVKGMKQAAQDLRDSQSVNITVKMYADVAAKELAEKDLAGAKAAIDKINEFVAKVDKDSEFGKFLLAKVAEVKSQYDALDAPKVTGVTPINATQVVVTFNKELNRTDAQTASKYSINSTTPSTASLSADGKTVTLTFATANQVEVTNGVFVVEPIKLAADTTKTTPKYTQVFTYEDTVKPEIASVEAKTNGTAATSLTVTASEPIQSSLAKVNGSYYAINFNGTDEATITGLSLDASKTHTIELINLTDKGGNVTVSTSKSFGVTVDTVAPTVALAPQGDKQILLTFSKAMDVNSVTSALASGAVKDEALANVNHLAPTVVAGSGNKQFVITITDALYANKTSRVLTVVFPNTIKDYLGNAIAPGTQSVTLTKDTVKPVATGYKVNKDASGNVTGIEVTFSEGLRANADPTEPTIVNMNGVIVTGTLLGGFTAAPVAAGDKKVTFTANTPGKVTGQYAFSFGSGLVQDQAETANSSDAFNYNIDFGTGATTFSLPANPVSSTGNTITVEFGRTVKGGAVANSATDPANYTLAGQPLPAGTTIYLDVDQDTATITLPAGSVAKSDTHAVFTVANIMSLNGALLNTYTGTVAVTDNTKPELNSAVLNADGTVTLGFSEALTVGPDKDDLKLVLNGSQVNVAAYNVTAVTAGADAGKYLVSVNALVDDKATAATTDDTLYVDVDGSGTFTNGDIVVATGNVSAGTVSLRAAAFTSVKVGTVAAPNTAKDAAGNFVKGNAEIAVK